MLTSQGATDAQSNAPGLNFSQIRGERAAQSNAGAGPRVSSNVPDLGSHMAFRKANQKHFGHAHHFCEIGFSKIAEVTWLFILIYPLIEHCII
jgi:hypothetical protein